MFKISKEQTEAYRPAMVRSFEERVVEHLRRHLAGPTTGATDEELRQRVRSCVPRARAYGLTTQREILCFVDVTYLLGERFDTNPKHNWAPTILRSDKLTSEERAKLTMAVAWSVHRG